MLTSIELLRNTPPVAMIRAAGRHAMNPRVLDAAENVERLQEAIRTADLAGDVREAVRLEDAAHAARVVWRARVEAATPE